MDLLRGFGVPFLAFTISLLVTFFICWYAHNEVNQKAQEKFVNEVKETQSLIKNRLESYVNALYGAQGLFAASKTVGRDEWSAYVSGIEITERYPGISLMAFIERVTAENKAAFVESVRSDTTIIPYGHPDFEIYPEGRREEYFVVKYVEPQTGNTKSLGFDIGSDPVRLTALKRARNTG